MNNFAKFLTIAEAVQKLRMDHRKATGIAADERTCLCCGSHAWRYGQGGLCFTCTTGESDASADYEIGEPYA